MSTVVEFQNVTKRYGEGPLILDGISFRAEEGDFISLIGPSGCGKSTLLKLIAGLSPCSSGSLTIRGVPRSEAADELAVVFQEPTLLPWLTAQENVELPLRLRGISVDQRRATATRLLSLVGLSERTRYFPRQLSGGQKMRVSIARALTLSPTVLLLDEPFGALDEMTRNHLNEELLALREQNAWTAFFVTHSVAEAVFLSNRVLIMGTAPGRICREIHVDLPHPRTEETRQSKVYQQLVAETSRFLRSVEEGRL